MKRKNPYEMLRDECRDWVHKVQRPWRTTMWTYPKAKLRDGWNLEELYGRVAAADQLGFDVRLEALDDGLVVRYVKRPGPPPWAVHP